jgi:hypothetical protein
LRDGVCGAAVVDEIAPHLVLRAIREADDQHVVVRDGLDLHVEVAEVCMHADLVGLRIDLRRRDQRRHAAEERNNDLD